MRYAESFHHLYADLPHHVIPHVSAVEMMAAAYDGGINFFDNV